MYRLRLLVNGRPIPVYQGNDGKQWVEARKSTKFEIKVENDYFNRILAVVSVDGLNVINAKHQDPMKDAPGYVINASSSLSIPGWLIDNQKAKEFVFASEKNSYTKKIGADQSNIGVIGVAIVSEKLVQWTSYSTTFTNNTLPTFIRGPLSTGDYPYENEVYCSSTLPKETGGPRGQSVSSNSLSSISVTDLSTSIKPEKKIAVGSGRHTSFSTTDVSFIKERLETTLTLYYDTRANLIKRGIIVDGPRPFPISGNYCPDV